MKEPTLFETCLSEITINYSSNRKYSEMDKVSCSADATKIFRDIWSAKMEHVEEFMILCLNRANKVLGWSRVSTGGLSGCIADPRVIFQTALKANASSVIAAHNHPSGNKTPSQSDIALTKKLRDAGEFLDIQMLDHLILTVDEYYSCADEGII